MPSDISPPKRPKGKPLETIILARMWIKDVMDWAAGCSEDNFFENPMALAATQHAFAALGEALKDLPVELLAREPSIPWDDIKGFRDVIAHDYWRGIEKSSIWDVITTDLPPLDAALARLATYLE